MLEHDVYPEEPETRGPLTSECGSRKEAERVGQIKWDPRLIREAIENGGGGWHGQGWLGKGNGLCCVQLLELMACANAVGKNWPQLTLIL
ncbi:unnamed protein product [Prunus armeniaca]